MSKKRFFIILQISVIIFPVAIHFSSWRAYSFTSSEEYLSHASESESCVTQQCHSQLTKGETFQHAPASDGKCFVCHRAESYPNKFGLDTEQSAACYGCHEILGKKIQSGLHVHGPVKNGDCSSCHDPHGSEHPFLLRESSGKLCSLCHELEVLYAREFIHEPVKDGNCGLCHDPHASNIKYRLTDIGANLCLSCHDDMLSGMTGDNVHKPLIESGCADCHDPHSGDNKLRLKKAQTELCFECHEDKKNEVNHYTQKHKPAVEGQCTSCHSPHFSDRKFLLLDKVDVLCYSCHEDNNVWKTRRFQHGPVVQGNCIACHNPHGSDNAFILRLAFPHKFYTSFSEGKYSLCFLCHKEALVTVKETRTVTSFRNGEKNLHAFHVNQKKGRNCRACHDIHASDIEHHLREEFMFGSYSVPIDYVKTDTGGRCTTGCHK